jgi:hypothetical protein
MCFCLTFFLAPTFRKEINETYVMFSDQLAFVSWNNNGLLEIYMGSFFLCSNCQLLLMMHPWHASSFAPRCKKKAYHVLLLYSISFIHLSLSRYGLQSVFWCDLQAPDVPPRFPQRQSKPAKLSVKKILVAPDNKAKGLHQGENGGCKYKFCPVRRFSYVIQMAA